MSNFLPDDYERQQSSGGYYKIQPGDNKLRIMSEPVIGFKLWMNGEAVTKRSEADFTQKELDLADIDRFSGKRRTPDETWGVVVWVPSESRIMVCEFSQRGIINGLLDYIESEDWGDPRGYDINIKKDTTGERVKYSVSAIPPKPAPKEAVEAYGAAGINLQERVFGQVDSSNVVEPEI